MSTSVTSREAILDQCQKLVMEKGMSSINMRTVATRCNVSVGAIYNCFPSKKTLITATIITIWKDIFHTAFESLNNPSNDFITCLEILFRDLQEGYQKYPDFLSYHSDGFSGKEKKEGKHNMDIYIQQIYTNLLTVLNNDKNIRCDAWNDNFTKEGFLHIIITAFINTATVPNHDYHCVLTMVQRSIY